MLINNQTQSVSRNSCNAIHTSYYSILLSFNIINIFLVTWILLCCIVNEYLILPFIFFLINYINSFSYLLMSLFLLAWFITYNWLNDLWIESWIALTNIEQITIVIGIKLMLISEWMLFIVCFWCIINYRLSSDALSLFFLFPLLSSYAFSIPFTNLIILLFSSYPLNGCQIALKSGDLTTNIMLLKTGLSFGILFILLQLKEFLYSFFSLSDCLIGSIFYFTTGLHGFHVLLGAFSFFMIIFNLVFGCNFFFVEFTFGLFLSTFLLLCSSSSSSSTKQVIKSITKNGKTVTYVEVWRNGKLIERRVIASDGNNSIDVNLLKYGLLFFYYYWLKVMIRNDVKLIISEMRIN